ncbi:MAG: flagellar motor protein MotB [Pseudomonadota bacterium]
MQKHRILYIALLLAVTTNCGIPKDEHNATLDELKKLKAEMAAQSNACEQTKAKMQREYDNLSGENQVMKSKLLSLGQDLSALKTTAGEMVKAMSQKEKRISELVKSQEAARRSAEIFKNLLGKFKKMIDSGQLAIKMRKGRMIVQMSDKILFDPGKDQIKKGGEETLELVAQGLASIEGRAFQVAGHTDDVPIKNRRFKSNWELSASRAVNVVKFMISKGMDPAQISAAGYGPFDPVGDNATEEGRQENRRIEITLMPSLEELPLSDS